MKRYFRRGDEVIGRIKRKAVVGTVFDFAGRNLLVAPMKRRETPPTTFFIIRSDRALLIEDAI